MWQSYKDHEMGGRRVFFPSPKGWPMHDPDVKGEREDYCDEHGYVRDGACLECYRNLRAQVAELEAQLESCTMTVEEGDSFYAHMKRELEQERDQARAQAAACPKAVIDVLVRDLKDRCDGRSEFSGSEIMAWICSRFTHWNALSKDHGFDLSPVARAMAEVVGLVEREPCESFSGPNDCFLLDPNDLCLTCKLKAPLRAAREGGA